VLFHQARGFGGFDDMTFNFNADFSADQFNPKQVSPFVTFTESSSDQALLGAIERSLANQSYGSFSDLCKQALRQFLLSVEVSPTLSLFLELQRQMVDLRVSVATLEHRVTKQRLGDDRPYENRRMEDLANQIGQLTRQLQEMEQSPGFDAPDLEPDPVAPQPALDPLLSRLAPILDDF
jgi:hypothetical protein